jgi:hypothetical protein
VNEHFALMAANGCDTAAIANDRKFYIMYDSSGWTNMVTGMPTDWTDVMSQYTSSSASSPPST